MRLGAKSILVLAAWASTASAAEPPPTATAPDADTVVHLEEDQISFTLPGGGWYKDDGPGAPNQLVRYRRGVQDTFTIVRTRSYGAMMDEGKRDLFRNSFKRAPDIEIESLICEKAEHQGLPAHQCRLAGSDEGGLTRAIARMFFTSRYSYILVAESIAPADTGWHLPAIERTHLDEEIQEPGPFSMLIETTGGGVGPLALLAVLAVLVFIFRKDIGHFFRRRRPKDDSGQ